jgi:hypothetical protein
MRFWTRPVAAFAARLLLGSALLPAPASGAQGAGRRCGWFDNSTPGNATLADRDGEWTIGIQGGHQADGDWPEFSDAQWVETNSGHHGYGCACLTMRVDPATRNVVSISKATARPLATCRRDKTLHEPVQG